MKTVDGKSALESKLSNILVKYNSRRDTGAEQFALSSPKRHWSWEWSSPGSLPHYFIASTTKLYVTALVMQLYSEGKLDLELRVATVLDPSVMAGIHILRGTDFSKRITIKQLLSHTSGIADYFEQRRHDASTQIGRVVKHDFGWTFDDVLRITKEEMSPKFAPSTPGKAFYSDTNYQLLGAVIEAVTGITYEQALQQRILNRLGLKDTYPFITETVGKYNSVAAMLYGTTSITIPLAMASVRADGGIVSTASDGIRFLEAFMSGGLFPLHYLQEMQQKWNPIFPPLEYGVGIMRFALPRYFTLFAKVPAMIGHSGASGALLYYVPELDLYISGTINQIKKRSLSYNLMTRLVMLCQTAWKR